MERQKIIFMSHCIINAAAKVEKATPPDPGLPREQLRKKLLHYILDHEIQVIQLPCPEFTMYGPVRWGHVKEQFDNPFFREHSRRLLEPVLLQMKAYLQPELQERFNVLGIIGIDGSPSCGVNYTCSAPWGGELSTRENLAEVIGSIKRTNQQGVFIDVLKSMMSEHHIQLPIAAIDDANQEALWTMLEQG